MERGKRKEGGMDTYMYMYVDKKLYTNRKEGNTYSIKKTEFG